MSRPAFARALVAVLLGGALGGLARHGVDVLWPTGLLPWGTFAVNVSGAILLAALPSARFVLRHHTIPAFLGTGVLGGFTTLSTFSEQTRSLVADGHTTIAATYVVGSLAVAMSAALLVRRCTTPAQRREFREEEGDE